MSAVDQDRWFDYDYAFLHVVPHVHIGTREAIGAVLHSRTARFIGLEYRLDNSQIQLRWPDLDVDMLEDELRAMADIAEGKGESEISVMTASERFHWITAPRSAVLQPSPVHAGRSRDPKRSLEGLIQQLL